MLLPLLAVTLLQGNPPALTLDSAIHRALRVRGRVGEAAAGVAEARATRRVAGQIPNPSLSFERTADVPHQHLLFDQSLSWLATRGADRAAKDAALRRARSDSTQLMAGVVQEVRIAFFGAVGAQQALRLVGEQVSLADSLALFAQRRFEAGDISRFEWEQAAQEARRSHQLLSKAREEGGAAQASLAHAVGWSSPGLPEATGLLDQGLDVAGEFELPADSIPFVVSAISDSAALALEFHSARRGRFPVPSIVAGAEWGDPDLPNQTLSVIGFAVPLPLWNSGGAEVTAARARAERGAAVAREARIEATRAVAESRIRLAETAFRARFARDSLVPAARQLRERALAAYRAGETPILAVLDAFRSEREVVQAEVDDLLAFQAALAAWRALFGRME
jgi:cobalt-zinc-cadmium efflux system outer membrane protein